MKKLALCLVLLAGAVGCGGDDPDGLAQRRDVAWRLGFTRAGEAPPVRWERSLDCTSVVGRGFTAQGQCLGSEWARGAAVRVALPGDAPQGVNLCHAYAHVMHEIDGQPDSGETAEAHRHPDFAPGSRVDFCAGLVDESGRSR